MPWIAAAMGLSALTTGAGALISSNAADKAADTSAAASRAAIDETRRQFDTSQGNLKPWLTTGASALGKLANLYGLDTYSLPPGSGGPALTPQQQQQQSASEAQTIGQIRNGLVSWGNQYPGAADSIIQLIDSGAPLSSVNAALQSARATTTNPANTAILDPIIAMGQSGGTPQGTFTPGGAGTGGTSANGQAGDMSGFFTSPDYQWRLKQAMETLEARASTGAFGGLDSGALRKAELQRSGDLASGEFNTYANRLSAISGIGQTAANQTADLGTAASTSIANRLQNAGDTQASAYGNQGKSWADALGKIGGYAASALQNRGTPSYGTPGSWSDYGYAF
jgi:hypothetical protein